MSKLRANIRYAIVNETDAPEKRMVCELVDGRYFYMCRAFDPRLNKFDGMNPAGPTSMEDFGFAIRETATEAKFIIVGEGVATYSDGSPRRWQDARTEFTLPRVKLTPADRKRLTKRRAA